MKTATVVVLAVLCACGAGCANWFLNGATMHSAGVPQNATARFTVPSCTMSNGTPIAGPAGQSYYLAQEARGPVLYELDANGSGAAITNHWSDERGVHFFTWVSGNAGWVFTFPHSRDQLPTRWVFEAGTYGTTVMPNGATSPTGQPTASCQMVPG